jgi:hypothetical protein
VTALECLEQARQAGPDYQRVVNGFVDDFRRADARGKLALAADPLPGCGGLEGLVSAVVSALCREAGLVAPGWVAEVGSPEPFFAFPARSYELRLRLMLESPAAFRVRNVFVPENYLERA